MNNFRKYRIELWIVGTLLFLLWTTSIFAEEYYLFYDDGTIEEVGVTSQVGVETSASEDTTVTLDVNATITDSITHDRVFAVHPGQKVYLECFFNRLGNLGVPFDQLVGHEMSLSYRLSGKLKYRWRTKFTIASGSAGLIGVGKMYEVPTDVQPGEFFFTTSAKISDFQVYNNRDRGVHAAVK